MEKWNPTLYDEKHNFVSKFGADLVNTLSPKEGEKILDLGCGTGDLAHDISNYGAKVLGIDASTDMIKQAQKKFPSLHFKVQDGTSMPFTEEFDAVFSNAALHWMKQPEPVVHGVYRALKHGGRFVGEMGGQGNIASIIEGIQESMVELGLHYKEELFPWYFPSDEDYRRLLEQTGFEVVAMDLYKRQTPLVGEEGLRNWLKMFSNNLLMELSDEGKEQVYSTYERLLRPKLYRDGVWVADYCRLRFIATK